MPKPEKLTPKKPKKPFVKPTPSTLTSRFDTSEADIDVLERIAPLGSRKGGTITMVLYGMSGSGKTTLWSTFPEKILAIICSGGRKPTETDSIDELENADRIDEVPLYKSEELAKLVDHVADSGEYKTVVLDHVSGFQDLVIKEILGIDDIPVKKMWGMIEQPQYGQCAVQCIEHFRRLLNLNVNVVFIGQERKSKEDATGSEIIAPSVGINLIPGISSWLNPACSYVAQTFRRPKVIKEQVVVVEGEPAEEVETVLHDKVEYCLRIGGHAYYMTKFRIPKKRNVLLPPVIVNPTYDKIISLIRGDQKPKAK